MKILVVGLILVNGLLVTKRGAAGGIGSSGGGVAIVCRADDNTIESAELLDIWEARHEGLTLLPPEGSLVEEARAHSARVSAVTGWTDHFDETMFWRLLAEEYEFVAAPLPDTGDLGNTSYIPTARCNLEQAAVFDGLSDPRGYVFKINQPIWNALPPQHQAALLAHETYNYVHRFLGKDVTSETARKLTGMFFTSRRFEPRISDPSRIVTKCSNFVNGRDRSYWLIFHERGQTRIQFTDLFGRIIYFKAEITLPAFLERGDFRNLTFGDDSTPDYFLQYVGDESISETFDLESNVFAGYKVKVDFSPGEIVKFALIDNRGNQLSEQFASRCQL